MPVSSCPQCSSQNVYPDGALWICADCGHEWTPGEAAESALVVRDSNGNVLVAGDTVTVIKDLKVKGASIPLKQGTVIRSIRLTGDPQEIDCRHETIKGLVLRAEFVKKR